MDIALILQTLLPQEVLQVLLSGGVIAAVPIVVQLHIQSSSSEYSKGDKVSLALLHGSWLGVALAFLEEKISLAMLSSERVGDFVLGAVSAGVEGLFAGLIATGGVAFLFKLVSKARTKS